MARNVGPVQVAMAGLYGMLGVKDGSNPDIITGFVQPVIDGMPWWMRATQELLVPSTVITATGALQSVTAATVPQNEWWHMAAACMSMQLDSTTVQPGFGAQWLIYGPGGAVYYLSEPIPLIVDAATNVYYMLGPGVARPNVMVRDLWVPPGFTIDVRFQGDNGNPDTCTYSIWGTRCRI